MTDFKRPVGAERAVVAAFALLALGMLSCQPGDPERTERADDRPSPMSARVLGRNEPIEREISAGETHEYALELAAGEFVEIVIDQRGADVVSTLFDPNGAAIGKIDRRIDRYGPEPLIALAEVGGLHRLEVAGASDERPTGRYEVRLAELRSASDADRICARAAGEFAKGEQLRRQQDYGEARASYLAALALWRGAGDSFWEAETRDRLGVLNAAVGDRQEALAEHLASAALFATVGDSRSQSLALNWVAKTRFSLGRIEEARRDLERAFELRPEGDHAERALLLVGLAQTYQALGEPAEAIGRYDQARLLLGSGSESAVGAQILHQTGLLYRTLGETQRGLDYLNEAEAAWSRLGDTKGQAASIHQRCRLFLELGRLDEAFEDCSAALELRRTGGSARGQVAVLTSLGEIAQRLGDRDSARQAFLGALAISRSEDVRAPQAEARILRNLGSSSDPALGRSYFEAARDLYGELENAGGEAEALLGLAALERAEGDLTTALEAIEAAVELVESVRPSLVSDDVSQSYFATVQNYFELQIDLLMDLHSRDPGAGYDERALGAAERARARSLLDLLEEAGADVQFAASAGLAEREHELQRQINVAERWRLSLLDDRGRSEPERASAAQTVRRLLDELGRLRAELRRENPHYAALTQPATLTLEEIQRHVLDEDALLLEFWLGAERSFGFLASSSHLSSFELPSRAVLEAKALRVHRLLGRSHRPESLRAVREALCDLSQVLLGPIADQLGSQRLVIVADGALQYLPFSALADPRDLASCPDAGPLLLANETTYLPSASVLAAQRSELPERPELRRLVAVLADPVFSSRDPRVAGAVRDADPASEASERAGFERLRYSRREAEAIRALTPSGASFFALDFAARKQLVQDGALSDFRIVHLATHAVIDSSMPGLSGIVFSLVDEAGVEQDGFLRVHELYGVRLPADLVVLSACRTALGREVRGEGLVGLTRAFAFAGAQRLIVGLWNVEDRSTAGLMEEFYRALLAGGVRPSAALREAQISLRVRYPAPYYWAGFVHQGEYELPCCRAD